ncbi:MAG: hypothetical protein H6566_18485 [Lewinellaceae bacterium]|nr:hypothetical protein [Lewinellaceae bacterium]
MKWKPAQYSSGCMMTVALRSASVSTQIRLMPVASRRCGGNWYLDSSRSPAFSAWLLATVSSGVSSPQSPPWCRWMHCCRNCWKRGACCEASLMLGVSRLRLKLRRVKGDDAAKGEGHGDTEF